MLAQKEVPIPAISGLKITASALRAIGSAVAGLKAPSTAPVVWCPPARSGRLAVNSGGGLYGGVWPCVEVGDGSVAELAEKGTYIGDLFQRACPVNRVSNQYLNAIEVVLNIGEARPHGAGNHVGRVKLHCFGQPSAVTGNATGGEIFPCIEVVQFYPVHNTEREALRSLAGDFPEGFPKEVVCAFGKVPHIAEAGVDPFKAFRVFQNLVNGFPQ